MKPMKLILSLIVLATALGAVAGCGSGSTTTAAEEDAFKNRDKSNLPMPKAGTPMSTPATSSLDTGSKPSGATAAAPTGTGNK